MSRLSLKNGHFFYIKMKKIHSFLCQGLQSERLQPIELILCFKQKSGYVLDHIEENPEEKYINKAASLPDGQDPPPG